MNKLLPLLAFSILLLVPVGAQNAFAHGFVELENVSLTPVSFTDPFDSPFGQNIVIFQPPLAGIDLFVHSNSDTIPFTDTVTVTIREGSITGNILGSKTQSVTATSGDPSFRDEIHFDFIPPLNLVPGNYVFQIETVEGQNKMQFAVNPNDSYPIGDSIIRGSPNSGHDLNFRTYTIPPLSCGSKTILNLDNQCVPDLTKVCGAGTFPDFDALMCFGIAMETVGGALLDINTLPLLVGAIGVNPVITGLVGITIAGITGQVIWFIHKKRKSENS